MHIFMLLLPLIHLPRGWGTVSYHPSPMCFFTVMMTHNTWPIQGNGCSKGITVDPYISKTKGPACLGFKVFFCCEPISFCPSPPSLLPCVLFNKGSGMERHGEEERNAARKEREARRENAADWGKSATSHCLPCGHN